MFQRWSLEAKTAVWLAAKHVEDERCVVAGRCARDVKCIEDEKCVEDELCVEDE